MKRIMFILRIILLIAIPAGLVLAVAVFFTLPRLVEMSPEDGSDNIPASVGLRLRFSRAMNAVEVQERIRIDPPVTGQFTWEGNTLIFNPNEPWPPGTQVQVELLRGARPAKFPALPLQTGRQWTFTVRQPQLVFLAPSDGPANIYLRDPSSNADRVLTDISEGVLDFSVGPDGEALYYSAANPQGGSDLYRLDLTSRVDSAAAIADASTIAPPEQILACSPADCRSPVVSPDGATLAYERTDASEPGTESDPQIWWMPLDPLGQPSAISNPADSAILPAWSPDGRLTFYNSRLEAFVVVTPEGEVEIRLENAAGLRGDWQPDGSTFVAPEILLLDENYSEVMRQNLDRLSIYHLTRYTRSTGAYMDLTREESIEDIGPVFSPDGRFFAFARRFLDAIRWTPGRQLWLMDTETLNPRPLTDAPDYSHFDFAWSPDGHRLAYVRFNQNLLTEPPEIWIMSPNTGEATQITSGGYAPKWIP